MKQILFKDLAGQHLTLQQINEYNEGFELIREGNSDVCIYTDRCSYLAKQDQFKYKILILLEPEAIDKYSYINMLRNKQDFFRVYTHHMKYVDNQKIFWYPFGGTFIRKQDQRIYNKTKNVSMILSNKRMTKLQQMRHDCVRSFGELFDVYGRSYIDVGVQTYKKIKSLRAYRYQIVIQNSDSKGFFTQKLLDCFLTGTVPIYKGTQLLSQFGFNEDGIIILSKLHELPEIIKKCNRQDYNLRMEALEFNFQESYKYLSGFNQIYKRLNKQGIL